jgi:hypothetical protein
MSKRMIAGRTSLIVALLAIAGACGDSDDSSTGTGGSAGSGGSGGGAGSGGTAGTGGTSGSGGSAGSGGSGGSGGTIGTGGNAGDADASTDGDSTPTDAGALDAGDAHCGSTGPLVVPTVPSGLEAPSGSTLVARYDAWGDQIYTCTATTVDAGPDAGTSYAWTLKAPSATLYEGCTVAATHFAGPTWKSSDGSSVVGARVASANSPDANAIPWLLLKATSHSGEGIFADVSAVQRLDTKGGKAPATGCGAGTVGAEENVAYSATYYFYVGGSFSGEGGTDSGNAADH